MIKEVKIGKGENSKTIRLRATAAVPRLYRFKFQRDFMQDIKHLANDKIIDENSELTAEAMTAMENIVYIMAKHGDVDNDGHVIGAVPNDVEEWLNSFDGIFSIYEAFKACTELWGVNTQSIASPAKKAEAPSEK